MASFAVARNTNMSLILAIRNLVCPLCGASMMGFRCLGRCRSDWRQEWERAMSTGSMSEGPRSGKSCVKHRV
jgi:tRNA(Ile2) C34 agmatinyltransferase TiaS